jgi:hypothetical protein
MTNVFKPEIFDIEIGGREYTIEFTRSAVKVADQMGVMNAESNLAQLEIVFYVGLMKHKPDITPNLAKRILYTAIGEGEEEGEYCLADFAPVLDEFGRWVRLVFLGNGEKSKKIAARGQTN